MNVLETLYILIRADVDGLIKDEKNVDNQTKKLEQSLNKADSSVQKLSGSFVGLGRQIFGAITAFASAQAVISGFKNAYNYTLELQQASNALNVNVSSLDAWGRAVQRNGGTVQGFQSSLKALAAHLNIRNQDALRLLPQLANIFQNAGTEKAQRFGQKLGLDQATILLLQHGRRELDALIMRQKELGVVTQKDAEIAGKFNIAWLDTTNAFRSSWISIGSDILPIFTKVLEFFTTFSLDLQKHKPLITGALVGIGSALGIFLAPLIIANAPIIAFTAAIGGLIAAFSLLYEDIEVFGKGGDSQIGYLLKSWGKFGEYLEYLIELVQTFNFLKSKLLGGSIETPSVSKNYASELQKSLNLIDVSPLSSQTSNSILNAGSNLNRNVTVNTGEITINTQAKDGEEVGNALATKLNSFISNAYRNATGSYDDGVIA